MKIREYWWHFLAKTKNTTKILYHVSKVVALLCLGWLMAVAFLDFLVKNAEVEYTTPFYGLLISISVNFVSYIIFNAIVAHAQSVLLKNALTKGENNEGRKEDA